MISHLEHVGRAPDVTQVLLDAAPQSHPAVTSGGHDDDAVRAAVGFKRLLVTILLHTGNCKREKNKGLVNVRLNGMDLHIRIDFRGVERNSPRGRARFKSDFFFLNSLKKSKKEEGSNCIHLFSNTVYRKCIKCLPKKGGRLTPTSPTFLHPCICYSQ